MCEKCDANYKIDTHILTVVSYLFNLCIGYIITHKHCFLCVSNKID